MTDEEEKRAYRLFLKERSTLTREEVRMGRISAFAGGVVVCVAFIAAISVVLWSLGKP